MIRLHGSDAVIVPVEDAPDLEGPEVDQMHRVGGHPQGHWIEDAGPLETAKARALFKRLDVPPLKTQTLGAEITGDAPLEIVTCEGPDAGVEDPCAQRRSVRPLGADT